MTANRAASNSGEKCQEFVGQPLNSRVFFGQLERSNAAGDATSFLHPPQLQQELRRRPSEHFSA